MERWGEPITAYQLRLLETGITYRRIVKDVVPEVEEREAARFNGYNWKEWLVLPKRERVDGVAYFRIRRAIDMNQQDAVRMDADRRRRHK
ncbi:hypothetical protein LCGC14_2535010 [marine sediment metagenome]|uniref:Uncharacterized protein n=1 Tax=marine sediment metagenome TaxID=412755 RepID=A0A0F9ASD3_9ZZZZ